MSHVIVARWEFDGKTLSMNLNGGMEFEGQEHQGFDWADLREPKDMWCQEVRLAFMTGDRVRYVAPWAQFVNDNRMNSGQRVLVAHVRQTEWMVYEPDKVLVTDYEGVIRSPAPPAQQALGRPGGRAEGNC